MSLPQFCDICQNILGTINLANGLMSCPSCSHSQELPENNKRIAVAFFNTGRRVISDQEAMRLAYEPTTCKITMKCPNCKYDILSKIRDEDYHYKLVCRKCEMIMTF